jgi:putative transposase
MKRSRSDGQIIKILKVAEGGVPVEELSVQYGFSRATFHAWRRKLGGLEVDDAKWLKALEDENQKLKGVVADLTLDKQILHDVLSRK